jgi:hypothetical protein
LAERAVLYEAATGQRPKAGGKGLIAPRALRPDIPLSLNAVIYKLLRESPDNRPQSADALLALLKVQAAVPGMSDGFLPWAETLPFPLGSILRHYDGEIDAQTKGAHLLNFFEALAEFIVTIELSAYKSDPDLFNANRKNWFGAASDHSGYMDFRAPTFGMWVSLHRRLANTTHRMLSHGTEDARRCYELFATHERDLVDALTSRDLSRILDDATQIRNKWSHSGVASPQDYARRLRELEDLLAGTQARLATSFETWELLKPGAAMFTDGVFEYTVTVLMGTNPAFRKEQDLVKQALDSNKLYLLNRGNETALELVPLLRIMAGQKTGEEAFYFYNRILSGSEVRWVSYHFHREPEVVLPDERTVRFVSELHAT